MRAPNYFQTAKALQIVGLLLAGMVIGGAVFMSVYLHNFDEVLLMNKSLKAENQDLKSHLEDWDRYKDSRSVVKTIVVSIESAPNQPPLNDFVKMELKKRVQQDLGVFKGQPIKELPDRMRVAKYMIRKKIYPQIEEKNYSVDIDMVSLLYSELRVWITASEFVAKR